MEFQSLTHFIQNTEKLNVSNDTPHIKMVIDSFHAINKGCSCTRQNRIQNANNLYSSLFSNLTELEKIFLKASFPNQPIIFKDGDKFLGQID